MNPCCLITGATGTLGSALAHTFWASGASLALVGRNEAALEHLTATLTPRPGQWVRALSVDLARPQAAGEVLHWARSLSTHLDVLINNAAIQGPIGVLWENDWEGWQETFQVNFMTPAHLCHQAAPWMMQGGGGAIINLSGGGAGAARARFSAYACAKTALVRLTETLAEELRPHGISVNGVAPGVMRSQLLAQIIASGPEVCGTPEHQRALAAMDSDAGPGRAAALCLFLASPQARGLTGRLLSAIWDPWQDLAQHLPALSSSDIYTLRRILPQDRGLSFEAAR